MSIAKFEKVSFNEFYKAYLDCFPSQLESFTEEENRIYVKEVYDLIKLPTRATKGSAGYDFFSPFDISMDAQTTLKIPTGIRVSIDEGWFLGIVPKSGLGFKYRLQLDNSFGVVDCDYFYSDNEGHIYAKLTNDGREGKSIDIKQGQSYIQGIFLQYGITVDDECDGIRNGGFGSTTKA